ncbi:MAG TPA: hypothetical protein VGB07_24855 [Blastocatellia bacterium]|jgi:hypothetical protein
MKRQDRMSFITSKFIQIFPIIALVVLGASLGKGDINNENRPDMDNEDSFQGPVTY